MAKGRIEINEANCKGCTLCKRACPQDVIVMVADHVNAKGYYPAVLVDPEGQCTGCALCAVACPDVCITVYRQVPSRAHAQHAPAMA
jgi:2-oxoglutarate ferredoxin oxidoreductase subunit delta